MKNGPYGPFNEEWDRAVVALALPNQHDPKTRKVRIGFFISERSLLTSFAAISDWSDVTVIWFNEKRRSARAELIDGNRQQNLALLRLHAAERNSPYHLALADHVPGTCFPARLIGLEHRRHCFRKRRWHGIGSPAGECSDRDCSRQYPRVVFQTNFSHLNRCSWEGGPIINHWTGQVMGTAQAVPYVGRNPHGTDALYFTGCSIAVLQRMRRLDRSRA